MTLYDTLGVSNSATQEDLRKAWLALARKYHPDITGGDKGSEEKLKGINEAYDTLKRPEKRQEYDAMLTSAYQAGAPFSEGGTSGGSAHNGFGDSGHFEFNGDYASFFEDLFSQKAKGQQRVPRPGRDLEAEASITLREAAKGTTKSFRFPSMVLCQSCSGTGAVPGTKPQICPQCKGAGHISGGRGSLFVLSQTCPLCRGRGEVIATPCPTCEGSGFKNEIRTLSVAIPAGVRMGARLRLAGQGEPGEPGAQAGDLFVMVRVEESNLFQRKRNDILCEVPITFTQAVLGDTVEVPTILGKARLKIPAGTQSGAILRMHGQGFPPLNGEQRGDQLVRVMIEIPRKVTPGQVAAIQELHETSSGDVYPKHNAYAERLRRWKDQ